MTSDELALIECNLRSGILPDIEIIIRLVREVRELQEAGRVARGIEIDRINARWEERQDIKKALKKIATHSLGHDSHNQPGERELCRACIADRELSVTVTEKADGHYLIWTSGYEDGPFESRQDAWQFVQLIDSQIEAESSE